MMDPVFRITVLAVFLPALMPPFSPTPSLAQSDGTRKAEHREILTPPIGRSPKGDSRPSRVYLSDSPWRSGFVYSVYDPHYGRLLPEVRRNLNGQGHPLTLDGRRYEKGFGCWRYSIIEVDVPQAVSTLSAVVGIDEEKAGASGDSYFSVWAEGKRLWQSPALSRDDPPVLVKVPLKGAKRIKLVTDAQGYENYDLADWCEVAWEPGAAASSPAWHFAPKPGGLYVRAGLHPFHLAYRGEDLPITVVTASVGKVDLTYALSNDDGGTPLQGRVQVSLTEQPSGEAMGRLKIPLAKTKNGLYTLKLTASGEGKTEERTVNFGLIDSHSGKPTQGSIYGVNHHEFIASYEPLAAAGIEWSRQWFCWAWIEPKKGEWSWNWHDERMAAAQEFGIKTIGVLGGIGQPAWMSDHVPESHQTTHGCPRDLADWEEYVRRVATRYRGRVKVWESWNEISGAADNNSQGWSVERYVDLHRRTYRILKEIDSLNKVLVSADSLMFVDRCLKAGLGDAYDGVVIHPYRPGATPEAGCANYAVGNTGDVLSVFDAAKSWLIERKKPGAEVWATEIGWALTGMEWPTIPVETHGEYLPRTFLLSQGSGTAANVCWHDFGLGMFGICDGQGYPRPALLSFAGLVSRLSGATPVERHNLGGGLQGFTFRRNDKDVVALWSESRVEFAKLNPDGMNLRATLYDFYGNEQTYSIPQQGLALPVTGRLVYLESPSLSHVALSRIEPVQITPSLAEVVAGHETTVTLDLENQFGRSSDFTLKVEAPDGLAVAQPDRGLSVAWREKKSFPIRFAALRSATSGERALPIIVTLPGGLLAHFQSYVRVLSPLALSMEPFDCSHLTSKPTIVRANVKNNDDRSLSGQLEVSAPDGFAVTPAKSAFPSISPGATTTLPFGLAAQRTPISADELALRVVTSDGAKVETVRSLLPVVLDADRNGLADGWRLNPENTGDKEQRNLAEVGIETGNAEFLCQKIDCQRFTNGWIILHRDGKDRVAKGKHYRVAFRARQRNIEGTLGVAVYNIAPWQSCGLEQQFRIGSDWQKLTTEFTATRDSDNVRFEFYFTETGTVWIEGMRLEEVKP